MSRPSELVAHLRNAFNSGKTRPLQFRIKQLQNLLKMYEERKEEIHQALWKDLRKSPEESTIMETEMLTNDIKHALYNLHSWAQPEYVEKDIANLLDTAYIQKEPYGVVLVIGSWNYPIHLTLMPVQGAIAAGNCVLIKPSEVSSNCAKLFAELIPQYLDNDCFKVFNGGPQETTELLKERFDYIFYTGSTSVGKIIHAAATKYLTPTTLELGGKSPCYIDDSVNFHTAAKRLMWGKLINVGQTCIAPDYVLCNKDVEKKFIEAVKVVVKEMYGDNPKESKDYCRVITERHFERLEKLLKSGGKVAMGGDMDKGEKYMAPTILTDLKESDPILHEEIFGPILPIVNVNDAYQAIQYINAREKPLALYIFSNRKNDVEQIVKNTSSGGVCVNDTIMHVVIDSLPFGGVGMSGMGSYHGKFSFDTFSHKKGVLHKDLGVLGETLGAAKYPPFTKGKLDYLNMMLAKRNFGSWCSLGKLGAFLAGVLSFYLWVNYVQKMIF